MGARTGQIVRLLIWQLSRPVMWSLVITIPTAWFAGNTYLDFFEEPIEWVLPVVLLACAMVVLTAWLTVAVHAVRIARTRPVDALRYE